MTQLAMSPTRWFIVRLLLGVVSTILAIVVALKLAPLINDLPIRSPYSRAHLLLVGYFAMALFFATAFCVMLRFGRTWWWSALKVAALIAVIPALPYLLHEPPLVRGAQKRTMANMRVIAESLEAYGRVTRPYPSLSSVPELSRLVGRSLPLTDEWRTPFVLRSEPGRYSLTSCGADGRPDPVPAVGPTTDFACDIVFVNGVFVAWPEGVQQ